MWLDVSVMSVGAMSVVRRVASDCLNLAIRDLQAVGTRRPSSRRLRQFGRLSISIASRTVRAVSIGTVAIVLVLSKSMLCPVCE